MMDTVVYAYGGLFYFAGNGRWKRCSTADMYTVCVTLGTAAYVDVAQSADWTSLTHNYGTPGPL